MSPEGIAAARRRIELRLADQAKKFALQSRGSINTHNARGMLRSGGHLLEAQRLSEAELLERSRVAWEVVRIVVDNEGWTPSEESRDQIAEIIGLALGPLSMDVLEYFSRVKKFMPDIKTEAFEEFRNHAFESALADVEIDLLGRRARRLPLEDELGAPRYHPAREHWRKALASATQEKPDLPTAAKEAVSGVESLAQLVVGKPGITLGTAVKELRSQQLLPTGADKILEGLYAFASDAPGSRHGSALPAHVDPTHWEFVRTSSEGAMRLLLDLDTVQ